MSFKIGSVCAVYGCSNYKQQKNIKSFYRFPKNADILKKWILVCKRKDLDDLLKTEELDNFYKAYLKKWILACKRKDLDDLLKTEEVYYFYKSYVVCSDHFEMECLRNKNLLNQGLIPGSVPTRDLHKKANVFKRKTLDLVSTSDKNNIKRKHMEQRKEPKRGGLPQLCNTRHSIDSSEL